MQKIVMAGAFDVAGGFANWRRLLGDEFEYFVERDSNNQYEDTSSDRGTVREAFLDADVIFYVCAVRDAHVPEVIVNDSTFLGVNMAEFASKTIIWLRGSNSLRANSDRYKVEYQQSRGVVCSTPDLCGMFGGEWMPNPVVLDHIEVHSKADLPVVCVQCPTDRKIKNTDDYKAVCEYLEKKYPAFKGIVKTGTYAEVMEFKEKEARIGFDHMQGYFSVNAMEFAWCGVATLASLWPEYMPYFQKFALTWTLPFVNVSNAVELNRELGRLLEYPELVEEEGKRDRAWMETFWNGARHVENLNRIVEEVGAS